MRKKHSYAKILVFFIKMFLFKLRWPHKLTLNTKNRYFPNFIFISSLNSLHCPFLNVPIFSLFMKQLEKTEEELFEAIKKRKVEKKNDTKKEVLDDDSSSDTDKTFEEFFSSSDDSSNEILQEESSDESKDS